MTTAATTLLGLALPVTGELYGTWGDVVNASLTNLLDTAIAGTTTISADADITLTTTTLSSNQARQAVILWTAGGTVTRVITAPAQSKSYVVINATSSSQSIKLVGVGPTTGITIVAGEKCFAAWNGTDFVKVGNTSGAGVFSTVTASSLTSGRVTFASTGGLLADASALTWDGTTLAATKFSGALNGTVGATTPSTGAFTTLSASSTATLSGLTASTALALDASKNIVSVTNTGSGNNVLATSPTLVTPALGTPSSGTVTNLTGTASININGTVGATTPSTGAFTTLSATDTITPSQIKGIVGTTTTNDAQAGSVGETVMSSSALTNYPATGTFGDLTSISLTAGDWDIAAATQQTTPGTMTGETRIGISTTSGNSATGLTIGYNRLTFPNATATADSSASIPMFRLQLGSTTTVYLKFFTEYTAGTPKALGTIIARRRR